MTQQMDYSGRIFNLENELIKLQSQFKSFCLLTGNFQSNNNKKIEELNHNLEQQKSQDLREEIKNLRSSLSYQSSQSVNLIKFTDLKEQFQLVAQQMNTFVTKEQLARQEKIKIQTPNSISNDDLKEQKANEKILKQFLHDFDSLKFNFQKKNEYTNKQVQFLEENLEQKIDLRQLKQYLKDNLIMKEDVNSFKECVDQLALDWQKESDATNVTITQFQKFINKLDYDVLFKASKMDLQEIREELIKGYNQQKEDIKISIMKLTEKLTQQYTNEASQIHIQNKNNVKDFLKEQSNDLIKKQILNNFQNLNLENLREQLEDIHLQLRQKAPLIQLDNIQSQKQSKLSAESMAIHNITLQKHMKHALVQVLHFMSLFESKESQNMKKGDISRAYNEMSTIVQQLDHLNVNNLVARHDQKIQINIRSKSNIEERNDSLDTQVYTLDDQKSLMPIDYKKRRQHLNNSLLPMVKLKPLLSFRKYS